MLLPRFFRQVKNKQFSYIPVYYNKQRDELREREKKMEQEMRGQINQAVVYRPNIMRGSFRVSQATRSKAERGVSMRVFVIVFLFMALIYFLLFR